MGQQANSGRHASLDDQKLRAAGRQKNQEMRQMSGRDMPPQTPGAFGKGRNKSPSGRAGSRQSGRTNLGP